MSNKKNPLISIIIPVYNGEKFIKKAIESVTSQTYSNLEILVINNLSNDNTLNIVDEMRSKDSRINIINLKQRGRSLARNTGLKKSSGDYILFLDADDFLEAALFEKVIPYLNEGNNFIWYKVKYIDENKKKIKISKLIKSERIKKQIFIGNLFPINSVIFSKKLVSNCLFPIGVEYCEDWSFWLDVIQNNRKQLKIKTINLIGANVRVHDSNTSRDVYSMKQYELKYLIKFKKKYRRFNLYRDLRILSMINNPYIISKEESIASLNTSMKLINIFLNLKIIKPVVTNYYLKKDLNLYSSSKKEE